MSTWLKLSAIALAAAGLIIVGYALLTPQPSDDTGDNGHMMPGVHSTYSVSMAGFIAVGAVLVVIGLMLAFAYHEYEPVPASWTAHPVPPGPPEEETVELPEPRKVEPEPVANRSECLDLEPEENYLVLRLLSGDERLVFKAIMDSGNQALQKDIIVKTKMSNAKVSRLLDKLAQKGVISKERHGSTNMVRIKLNH